MNHNGRCLTRPATPQAFKVSKDSEPLLCGRYSFINPSEPVEEVSAGAVTPLRAAKLPVRLREEKITVRLPAVRR